jgi:hypothetical protein
LFVVATVLAGVVVVAKARRRAERDAVAATAAQRAKAAQRRRIPAVSNNVKGVTATQTIQPLPAAAAASNTAQERLD